MNNALVTLTDRRYLPGTIAMVYSARLNGYTGKVVAMHTDELSLIEQKILHSHNIDTLLITGIDNPRGKSKTKNINIQRFLSSNVYSKLHTWSLDHFSKILFVDSDVIFLKPFTNVFNTPMKEGWIAACEIDLEFASGSDMFNSGVFLTVPGKNIYNDMMGVLSTTSSYDGGDQGFLNNFFKDRVVFLSASMNVSKRESSKILNFAKTIHYLNLPKPWHGGPNYDPEGGVLYRNGADKFKIQFKEIREECYTLWWRCYQQAINSMWKQTLGDRLNQLNKIVYNQQQVEGNLFYQDKQQQAGEINTLFEYKRQKLFNIVKGKKSVLEIGVNGCHSALTMLTSNPELKYYGFDINWHSYTQPAVDYIKTCFKNVNYIVGDSKLTIPEFKKNIKFDVIHIDGGHSIEQARADIENCKRLAKKDTYIVFDDCNSLTDGRKSRLLVLWNEYVRAGYIREIDDWNGLPQTWDSKVGVYV